MEVVRRMTKTVRRAVVLAAGVALEYYLDPRVGSQRRRELREKAVPALRQLTQSVRDKLGLADGPQTIDMAA